MKLTALILILSLVTSMLAQEPDREKPDDLLTVNPARDLYDFATLNYNSARDEKDPARKRSAYLSAAKAFDKFIRGYPRDPKSLEAWYFLGMSYRNLGEARASRSCFETAATRWETGRLVEASALFLASDDYKAENWGNAARWFQIVAKTTKNPEIKHQSLYRRFLCFNKLDDQGSMALALKAVLAEKGSPYEEQARLSLARLYRDSSSPREAPEQFAMLAKAKDEKIRTEAVLQAALTAQALKDKELTKTWFKIALAEKGLKDINGKTQLALMNFHYQDKEWKEVIDAYRAGNFELDPKGGLQRLIIAAKAHEALGNEKEVERLYSEISRLSPGSATSFEAAYRLLVKEHETKNPRFPGSAERFLKTYGGSKAGDPKIHSIRLLLAEHCYAAKNFKAALDQYRLLDLTKVDDSNALGVRYHVAKTQLALKNEKGALAAIDAFIKTFPDAKQSTQLRLDRAELLSSLGRKAEATNDYLTILKTTTDPKLKRILTLRLAAIYQAKEDWANFARTQRELLDLPEIDNKTAAASNFWLGWNEMRLKNQDLAIAYLRQARLLDPKTYTAKVGPILIKNAFAAEKIETLEKEILLLKKESPNTSISSDILRWLGAKLIQDNETKRGWPFLHEGLQDSVTEAAPLLWKLYSQASLTLNKHPEALAAADKLFTLEKNGYRKAEALYLKAQAHTDLKQFNEARQATADALDLRPQGNLNIRLRLLAGDIDIASGQPAEAIRHYIVVESTIAQTPTEKKEAREKVISTLKAIGTPKALEMLKKYQE